MCPLKSCNGSGEATSYSSMFKSFMLFLGLWATKAGKLQIPLRTCVYSCCNSFFLSLVRPSIGRIPPLCHLHH